ncbi:Hypothetical predicted protein [Cloeon dipterum]|uniref:Uncharacterized protein n=1 Tax=Cloeon dipterum TaxID=197152 RepID=A0A8S1E754_9INSE|nr:Hypothetical predicted protein [Cloeon dipterum]
MFYIILMCSNVFIVILSILTILWLILLGQKRNIFFSKTLRTPRSVITDNHDDVGPAEVPLYEEIKYDQVAATPLATPNLYERPIFLSMRPARRDRALPERPRTFENFGEATCAPVVDDDVGPALSLYDDVAPATSTTSHCEEYTSESAQYLQILP